MSLCSQKQVQQQQQQSDATTLPSHTTTAQHLKSADKLASFLCYIYIIYVIVYGNSKSFEVKVCMHQGSALSPLLFVIVREAISREFRVALPWELLYADDLAVIAETEEELI